jgi:hypothetical protein
VSRVTHARTAPARPELGRPSIAVVLELFAYVDVQVRGLQERWPLDDVGVHAEITVTLERTRQAALAALELRHVMQRRVHSPGEAHPLERDP